MSDVNVWDQFQRADAAAPQAAAPNVWDQFQRAPLRITVTPSGTTPEASPEAPQQAPQQDDTLTDVAKSAPTGVLKGLIGLAGLPGDLSEYGARGLDVATRFIGNKLGIDIPERPNQPFRFGAGDIQKGIENITGPLHEPQTTAGNYAQTAGEFLPGIVGGPEALASKLVTRVAAPALASEAAAQATKGTAAEPWARLGGAVLGSVGAARALRPAPAAIPAADEIRDASRAAYAQARNLGLEIHPAPVVQVAHGIEQDLTNLGLTARNVPETYGVIRNLQNPPPGSVMRATDFENARQELVQALNNPTNRREAVAARTAINHLDNYLANIPARDVLQGDAARASELFRNARANWAAASRADTVGGKLELGDLNAATANSGQNIDNATRQAVKQLIRPDKNGRTLATKMGFNDEEIAQMNRVARGTFTGNLARFTSHLFGGGGGLGAFIAAGAGALIGGPSGAVTLPAAGYALKAISNNSTARQARILDALVRSRSPAAQAATAAPNQIGGNPTQSGMLSGLLALTPPVPPRP